MENINLNYLKVFYYVVKNESFVKAAKELNLSQPNVSKTFKELENNLNTKLIIRINKKKWRVSEKGERLYNLLNNLYKDFEQFSCELKNEKIINKGKIRIGIDSHYVKFFLIDIIKEFTEKYPHISFEIISEHTDTLLKLLNDEQLDFCIDTLPMDIKMKDNMLTKITKNMHIAFVANEEKNIKKLKELESQKLLLLNEESVLTKEIIRICNEKEIKLTTVVTSNSNEILKETAKAGIGIACMFEEVIAHSIKKGNLFKINIEENLPIIKMNIIYKKDLLNVAAKKVIEMISKL